MYARKQKTFALTTVHPAYAYEATTAKEPARSQVAGTGAMKEQAGPTSSIPNVWVTLHDAGHVTISRALPPLFLRAGQRSYVELLRGRRKSLGTRLRRCIKNYY